VAHRSAIAAEGLTKRFGPLTALDDVNIEAAEGTVLALLGPNGAGKTTVVRILAMLLRPDAGRVTVFGHDVVIQPATVRRMIGLSGQYAAVDGYLTGPENLRMIGRLSGLGRRAAARRAAELVDEFDLSDAGRRLTRTYSGGMRRRLDVAASLVAQPRVLFLDEPTTGLDPRGRVGLWRLVAQLAAAGTTVLLTTQYLEEADRLANAIVVLDHGAVIAAGTSEQLKAQVGGDRLELTTAPNTDPAALAAAMAGIGTDSPTVDPDMGTVVIPVADGATVLPQLAQRLANNGLAITDLALRRPSLDDVFFALTGQPAKSSTMDRPAGVRDGR
jgi:daunorubicin resistance ABC transporter ATP-binding subunit